MNILIVVPSISDKGPIFVARNIMKHSKNNEFNYSFLGLRKTDSVLKRQMKEENVDYYELDMGNIPKVSDFIKIREVINSINPDIIHLHCFWPTVIGAYFLRKYKLITTLHNIPTKDYFFEYGKKIGWIMSKVFINATKKMDVNIAISEAVEKAHMQLGVQEKKLQVIYNGIEDKFIDYYSMKHDGQFKVLSVSELSKVKNHLFALQIIKELHDLNFNINYEIIGDGQEFESISKFIKDNNMSSYVICKGIKLPRDEVFKHIKKAKVLLLTSFSEGFGLVVAESMMMGIVPVVSNLDVMKELLGDKYPELIGNTIEEYIEIFKRLCDEKYYSQLRKELRKQYETKFSVIEMSKSYEKIYVDI